MTSENFVNIEDSTNPLSNTFTSYAHSRISISYKIQLLKNNHDVNSWFETVLMTSSKGFKCWIILFRILISCDIKYTTEQVCRKAVLSISLLWWKHTGLSIDFFWFDLNKHWLHFVKFYQNISALPQASGKFWKSLEALRRWSCSLIPVQCRILSLPPTSAINKKIHNLMFW